MKAYLCDFPIGKYMLLEQQHAKIREEFLEINEIFRVAVENADWYYDKPRLENILFKMNIVRDHIKKAYDKKEEMKFELAN